MRDRDELCTNTGCYEPATPGRRGPHGAVCARCYAVQRLVDHPRVASDPLLYSIARRLRDGGDPVHTLTEGVAMYAERCAALHKIATDAVARQSVATIIVSADDIDIARGWPAPTTQKAPPPREG